MAPAMWKVDWLLIWIVAFVLYSCLSYFWLERRSHLFAFLTEPAEFELQPGEIVMTHFLILRSIGRREARDVRLGHAQLPAFTILPKPRFTVSPEIRYEVKELADPGPEIVFPYLMPGTQITVSYLYAPPLTQEGIHRYVKSDGKEVALTRNLTDDMKMGMEVVQSLMVFLACVTLAYWIFFIFGYRP